MGVATIGTALVEKRGELKLEKGRAAEMIGMSRTTYSSYENDAQRPSVDVFPALAKFLQISIEELLTLYGASCIAAARSSLASAGSTVHGQREEETLPPPIVGGDESNGSESSFWEEQPGAVTTSTSTEPTVTTNETPGRESTPPASGSDVSLELGEVSDEPPVPTQIEDDEIAMAYDSSDYEARSLTEKKPTPEDYGSISGHKKKKKKKGKKG